MTINSITDLAKLYPPYKVSERTFHCFEELLTDMIEVEFFSSLDYPTQCAFSWTCRKYYRLARDDFNNWNFAAKCAKLGYEALLLYSIDCGAPTKDEVCLEVAAKNGFFFDQFIQSFGIERAHLSLDAAEGAHFDFAEGLYQFLDQEELNRDELINACISNGHFEQALTLFQSLTPSEKEKAGLVNDRTIFDAVFKYSYRHANAILKAIAKDPTYVWENYTQEVFGLAVSLGNIELFEMALKKGASLKIAGTDLRRLALYKNSAAFDFVQHVYSAHNLSLHFLDIPLWATREALNWMLEKNCMHLEDSLAMILEYIAHNTKLPFEPIEWFLEHGCVVTHEMIRAAAKNRRLDLLNYLWKKNPQIQLGEDSLTNLITDLSGEYLKYLHFRRPFRWLIEKGAAWGACRPKYVGFANLLLEEYDYKYAQDFVDEFKMPVKFDRKTKNFTN